MLDKTSPNVLHIVDAWAEGNTDCAFAINNFVGIQRSHASNDWKWGWVDFVSNGRGTYVYAPKDPYWVSDMTTPHVDTLTIATVPVSNTTDTPITTSVKYVETSSQTTAITRAWQVGLKLTTDFHLLGHKFGLEASYQGSGSEANTKTTTSSTEFSATVTVPAQSSYVMKVEQSTTSQTCMYAYDLALGSDNPNGSIGKCTTWGQQGNWNKFYRIEDILKGAEKQQIKYQVDKINVITTITLERVSGSEDIPGVIRKPADTADSAHSLESNQLETQQVPARRSKI